MDDFFGDDTSAQTHHAEEVVEHRDMMDDDFDMAAPAPHPTGPTSDAPAAFAFSTNDMHDSPMKMDEPAAASSTSKPTNALAKVEAEHRRLIDERREHNAKLQSEQRAAAEAFWKQQRSQRSKFLEERVEANLQHTRKVLEQRDELFARGTLWQKVQSMTYTRSKDERGKKQGRIREILTIMNVQP